MSKGQYVCQRAAHAIIAEIGELRVSGDALGAINLFIDEFLSLLIRSSRSIDLVQLKSSVIQLLPHSLGKNALVEAEIELKQQVEAEQHDFTSYEKMRILNRNNFPVEEIIPILQIACADYCTLTSDDNNNINRTTTNNSNINIPPVVVIYVTAIVEHLAEYLLNTVAMTADQADAEHIRVKEVLVTLLDDPQVNVLFQSMNLKEKLEKRVSTYPTMNTSNIHNTFHSLPTPSPSPISLRRDQPPQLSSRHSHNTCYSTRDEYSSNSPDISFNEFLGETDDNETRVTHSSLSSIRSSESINDRPLSIMSNGTIKSSGSKSRFNFFGKKEKRSSTISLNFSSSKRQQQPSSPSTMTSPTAPSFQSSSSSVSSPINNDFDDLIRSGKTKKVTLTPNRLKSIEVKEDNGNDVTPWENTTAPTTNNTKPTRIKKRSTAMTDSTPPPPLPPLPRLNRDNSQIVLENSSPPLTPASSVASRPSQRSRHSIIYEESSMKSKSSMKSSCTNEDLSLLEETSTPLNRNPSKMSTSSSVYSNGKRINSTSTTLEEENKPAVKLRFERPSSMVVKRASMGSRPPSFHESALTDNLNGSMLMAAAAGSVEFDNLRQEYERKSSSLNKRMTSLDLNNEMQQDSITSTYEQNMIYVVPTATATTTIKTNKSRSIDRGCQTDPIALHTLLHHSIHEEAEEEDPEEEWFIEEEEWENPSDEEKCVVEWLLGNA